jgi:hypothetical protein
LFQIKFKFSKIRIFIRKKKLVWEIWVTRFFWNIIRRKYYLENQKIVMSWEIRKKNWIIQEIFQNDKFLPKSLECSHLISASCVGRIQLVGLVIKYIFFLRWCIEFEFWVIIQKKNESIYNKLIQRALS